MLKISKQALSFPGSACSSGGICCHADPRAQKWGFYFHGEFFRHRRSSAHRSRYHSVGHMYGHPIFLIITKLQWEERC